MTRRIAATILAVAGFLLIRLSMRIARVQARVHVVRRGGQVYPSSWTSAHEQQPVNTVPPRESN